MSREWPISQKAGKCCFQWEHVEPIDTLRNQFNRLVLLVELGPERTLAFRDNQPVQRGPGRTWNLDSQDSVEPAGSTRTPCLSNSKWNQST